MRHLVPQRRRNRQACLTLILLFIHTALPAAEIYRWQDGSGTTHYGDAPPASAESLRQLTLDLGDTYYRISAVIDGDTVELLDGRRVRLLGIDAPEVAHHGRPGEELGERAKHYLQRLLEGKRVQLRHDIDRHDGYRRLLAHLYLEDGRNVNALLLEQGLAHALFKWPNLKQIEAYYAAEQRARNHGRGIWDLPALQVRPMERLDALRNRFVRLRGRLTRVEHKRRLSYLLFGERLRVGLRQKRLPLFRQRGIDLESLAGQRVTLRGWLGRRHGSPYLELEHPYQIERVE